MSAMCENLPSCRVLYTMRSFISIPVKRTIATASRGEVTITRRGMAIERRRNRLLPASLQLKEVQQKQKTLW